jgi:hypothetical protein
MLKRELNDSEIYEEEQVIQQKQKLQAFSQRLKNKSF